jgi:hypothetical protein
MAWLGYLLRGWVTIVVVFAATVLTAASEPLSQRIDALIDAQLADQPVAEMCDDAEFVRRIFLDLTGRIPSVSETQKFWSDSTADKRTKLIEQLLASDEFANRMADVLHVMLMERRGDNADWLAYLRESFRQNKPWNQLVREMIAPNADSEATRASAFFISKRLEHYGQNAIDYPGLTRDVGRMFLGMDLQCAQCHDHLFIKDYKQVDFQGLHAVFLNTSLRNDTKFPAISQNLMTKKIEFQSVFEPTRKSIGPRVPGRDEIAIPAFAKGEEYLEPPDKKTKNPGRPRFNPLEVLAEQIVAPDNLQFARNTANRFWFVLMGRGLVHPLDLHHSENPPSHPELLDLLAKELIAHQFDLKWFLRELALTRTYQRSGVLPAGAQEPLPERFAVALEKPLSAEQLWASVSQATGTAPSETLKAKFVKAFAHPPMEPEGEFTPSLKSALFLMNDADFLTLLEPKENNLVARLQSLGTASEIAEELYLAVLTRRPTAEEVAEVTEQLQSAGDNKTHAIRLLVWALLASTEFCLNH